MVISKSKFMAGVQCLKRLYLQVHQPELAAAMEPADEALIEQGREVGLVARRMFPDGVVVGSENGLEGALRTTRELISNPEVPAVFEAAFEHGGVFVRVDILHRRRDGRWRLVEVKSTADLKDHHLEDVAIQARVVSRCGVDLASVCLAHVKRTYIYQGGTIDARRFFKVRNLTRRVKRAQPKLTFLLRSEFRVLAMPSAPDLPPGPYCNEPVTCEFFDRCNPPKPVDHIFHLPRIHASAVEELQDMGIESIRDIPDDFELSDIQRRVCTSVQTGEPWFDNEGMKTELAKLEYPLFFMDFETINPAVPRFRGMRPFDQIPFQWSVRLLRGPGAKSEHYEFLATDRSDPRPAFISSLCDVLGEKGSVIVYNQQFESSRLAELAVWLPEFAGVVGGIQRRLFDLLPLVRNHVYHPAFGGSFSLKAVLPALVPEMTYEGMEVADGQAAGLAWQALVRGSLGEQRDRLRKALLDYCGQDTLAMVRLLDNLRSVLV